MTTETNTDTEQIVDGWFARHRLGVVRIASLGADFPDEMLEDNPVKLADGQLVVDVSGSDDGRLVVDTGVFRTSLRDISDARWETDGTLTVGLEDGELEIVAA